MTSKVDAARRYIELGWPVFILGMEKTPLPNCPSCRPEVAGPNHNREACTCLWCHGFYAATLDPTRIEAMITGRPEGMLAVRTGSPSGLVIVDAEAAPSSVAAHQSVTGLDVLDTWETWIDDDWSLPKTLRQRTGKGGLHLVYRIDKNARISSHVRILPQVDIKAEFGYIAVWSGDEDGSASDGRHWLDELSDETIANASPQLLAWLAEQKGKSIGGGNTWGAVLGGDDYKSALADGATAGQREGFFARLSFDCFAQGMKRHDVEALMHEHWSRCEQPAGDFFPWHWVEYKIERDSVNVKPETQEIPAWRPSTAGLGVAAVEISMGSTGVVEVHETGPGRPDLHTHLTDTGNGERYAKRMRDVARYDPVQESWFVWNGAHWVKDTYGRALLWTKEIVRDIFVESIDAAGDGSDYDEAIRDWAMKSESMDRRSSMLRAASLEEGMVVQPEDFDADPWVIVTRNGTVDLRTQTLRDSRPEDLNTKFANVSFDPDARAPKWEEHVRFLTKGDPHLAAYLQRVAGYTLTGLVIEQKFFFFEGKGANGKNVFIEPLLDMMGSYGLRGSTALITGGDEQHPTIIMQLLGKRMVFVDEAKQGRALNVERIKELTGSKTLNARAMKQDFVNFDARLKLYIAGNNHPKIADSTDGTWRRMQRVMCLNRVPDGEIIKDYARILFDSEGSGILNWCLEGLRSWLELGGVATPKSVLDAVAEYRSEEDILGVFIDECLIVGSEDDWVTADEVFAAYQLWAGLAGLKGSDLYNKIVFGKNMSMRGYDTQQKKIGGDNKRRYRGLRVKPSIPTWRPGQG